MWKFIIILIVSFILAILHIWLDSKIKRKENKKDD